LRSESPRVAEDYLRVIELIDVERAGDFLVMAATLMEIKSKMLLPRSDEVADETADPRSELVRQLVEYKKFKRCCRLAGSSGGTAAQPITSTAL